MSWLKQNAGVVEALAAGVTALVAVAALVGVKLQIDANDQLQRAQSARDIYREFLELTVTHPDLAQPSPCRGLTGPDDPQYAAYLEFLLYTADQTTSVDPSWEPVMEVWLNDHAAMLCAIEDWSGYASEVEALVARMRPRICQAVPACN